MKSKSKVSKNKKNVLIYILFIAIGIIIGISSTIAVQNLTTNKDSEIKEEQPSKKESPYTLEELYDIMGNPEKYKKLNDGNSMNTLAYTIFHFYDYFNKSTPVKVFSKIKKDEDGKIISVESKYLSYYEFMELSSGWRELEKKDLENCEEEIKKDSNYRCTIPYNFYVDQIMMYYVEK